MQTAVNLLLGIASEKELQEAQELKEGTGYYQAVCAAIEEQHGKGEGLNMQQIKERAHLNPSDCHVGEDGLLESGGWMCLHIFLLNAIFHVVAG